MTKEELALEVIDRLKKEYPDAGCTLDYDQAWKLLVSVRLAAQCTDKRVDMITPKLFEKFPSVAALAAAEPAEIEEIVRPCGLGPSKARDISGCMRMLHEQYHDRSCSAVSQDSSCQKIHRNSYSCTDTDADELSFGKIKSYFVFYFCQVFWNTDICHFPFLLSLRLVGIKN